MKKIKAMLRSRILLTGICLALAVSIALAGTTYAYLTDETLPVVNSFTTYTQTTPDGNLQVSVVIEESRRTAIFTNIGTKDALAWVYLTPMVKVNGQIQSTAVNIGNGQADLTYQGQTAAISSALPGWNWVSNPDALIFQSDRVLQPGESIMFQVDLTGDSIPGFQILLQAAATDEYGNGL